MPPPRCGVWRRRQAPVANQAFRRLEGRCRWPSESDVPAARTAHVRWLPRRPLAVRDRQEPPRSRLLDGATRPRLRAKVRPPPWMLRSPHCVPSRSRKRMERNRRAGKRSDNEVRPRPSIDCDARQPHPLHQLHADFPAHIPDSAPIDVPHHPAREPFGCAPVEARVQRRRSAAHVRRPRGGVHSACRVVGRHTSGARGARRRVGAPAPAWGASSWSKTWANGSTHAEALGRTGPARRCAGRRTGPATPAGRARCRAPALRGGEAAELDQADSAGRISPPVGESRMITARCRIHGGRSHKAKELRELYGDIMTDLSRSEAGAGVVNGNFSFAGDKQRILIGVAAETLLASSPTNARRDGSRCGAFRGRIRTRLRVSRPRIGSGGRTPCGCSTPPARGSERTPTSLATSTRCRAPTSLSSTSAQCYAAISRRRRCARSERLAQAAEAAQGAGHGMREQVGVLVGTRNVAELEFRRVRAVSAPLAATLPRALRLPCRSTARPATDGCAYVHSRDHRGRGRCVARCCG